MTDLTSYVYAKDFQGGSEYGTYGWTTCDQGKRSDLIGGYRYNSKNWVLALKFTMPENASSITLGFFTISGANGGEDSQIRYKVTTTEDTAPNYTVDTTGDGDFTVKNPAARTELTIAGNFIKGTTYYVYFWTAKSTSDTTNLFRIEWDTNEDGKGFYANYAELSGLVYIDNGTAVEAFEAYIDNGTSWDRVIPYIDNGASWDLCN